MKKAFLIFLGILFVAYWIFSGTYNRLVTAEESVKTAWSQVENVYQRRLDLIPNLVETVKGYAAHESETLEKVIEARSKISQITLSPEILNDPQSLEKFQQMQGELSSALSRLMVISEQYPNLKANENFLALQSQLEGTENRITVERKRYNETAQAFNTLCRVFPNVVLARLMGFQQKAYFKADTGANQAPQVQFEH